MKITSSTIEEIVQEIVTKACTTDHLLEARKIDSFDVSVFLQQVDASKLQVVHTHEGPVSTVVEKWHPVDCSKQTTQFDLHTDGLYRYRAPDIVGLYCENPGRGDAPTRFVDTGHVCKELASCGVMSTLRRCQMTYIGRDGQHFPSKLVQRHPVSGGEVLNLGARGYICPMFDGDYTPSIREITDAVAQMYKALDNAVVLSHRWAKGEMVVCDNHTYVHGRDAYAPDTERTLLRFWLSVKDRENDQERSPADHHPGVQETIR
jgi:alpha-ketoglutarate-dependent taurine dioxygenase